MIDPKQINELVQKFMDNLPEGVKKLPQDAKQNFRVYLHDMFSKMDLVTREEFDAQVGVLQRTRKKVEELELKLKDLEPKKKQH